MPTIRRFRDILALWKTGILLSEDVASYASALAESGDASPAIEELSWLSKPIASELEPLLSRATRALGEIPPSPEAAAWRSAYIVAEWISAAEVSPRVGAQHMHRLCFDLNVPEALSSFIYYDSDYGLGPGPREADEAWFDERIRQEALRLTSSRAANLEGPPVAAA